MRTETRTGKQFDMFHNVSSCAFMGRAEVLLLFIFMNSDFLDSTPVGISHTCPHNSPAIPTGKCNERSNITLQERWVRARRELGQLNVFLCAFSYVCVCVCVHAAEPIEAICPALVHVPMAHFSQLRLKSMHWSLRGKNQALTPSAVCGAVRSWWRTQSHGLDKQSL